MTHIENQIKALQALQARMDLLEAELASIKRGQKLAAEDADHYEAGWKAHTDHLKKLLADTGNALSSFLNLIPGPKSEKHLALLRDIDDALQPDDAALNSSKPFEDFDAELTIDLLGLVIECEIPYETIVTWTREERAAAEQWAAQQHALASDNEIDGAEILPKPVHVRKLEETNPKRSELYEVAVRLGDRPPPAWQTWAERMKSSPNEWARLHRLETAMRAARSAFRLPERDQAFSKMCQELDAIELERVKEFQDPSREKRKKP